MKRYFEHMQEKTPHERRQHAMHVATVVTALVFVGWLGTLGLRLGSVSPATTAQGGSEDQLANVIGGAYAQQGGIEVATTSVMQ
jgi:hypothetical protein